MTAPQPEGPFLPPQNPNPAPETAFAPNGTDAPHDASGLHDAPAQSKRTWRPDEIMGLLCPLVLLALWGLGFLLLISADATSDYDSSMGMGFSGIFVLLGAFLASFALIPLGFILGARCATSKGRTRTLRGALILALQIPVLFIPIYIYSKLQGF
ncbi:hypothetical protein [Corynebacterium sp.]|uniref:hypothetical protein n=1 Tax=Corynebacterium sp. TaxID=1720 RepID=UPI0026DD8816|nr:hypothetical protein [Corynebacterium sp.]MDO5032438.1 hypothetical protein [Corynebacterium sp.]